MSVAYEGFRKNREPEPEPEIEKSSVPLNKAVIAISALIGGTIILTIGVAFALGLPWAAVTLGLIMLIFGFVLGKDA